MSDPIIELADLVVADLNDASLGFTAVRAYLPVLKREELSSDLKVFVIPKSEVSLPHSRSVSQTDWTVYIGVIKKLGRGSADSFDLAELDSLRDVVKSIRDRLKFSKLGPFTWIRSENETLFDPDHLEEYRQFTSVLNVTYRGLE